MDILRHKENELKIMTQNPDTDGNYLNHLFYI